MAESSAEKDTVLTARESLYTLYRYACIANSDRDNDPQEIINAFDDVIKMFPEEETPPTMDEIEWDNSKHYLAEARVLKVPDPHRTVCMLSPASGTDMLTTRQIQYGEETPRGKYIRVFDEGFMFFMESELLAPTGRKYKLIPEESA